jgi:hypothetical protein
MSAEAISTTETSPAKKQVVFCLTSARAGTTYMSSLIDNNVDDITSKHEPQPDLFGRCIDWLNRGELDKLRSAFLWKKRRIDRSSGSVYIETNHAFLKSFAEVAMEFYPDMKLVHIMRDPLKVALSEANRQADGDRFHLPLRHYRDADGVRRFRWCLTGTEPIFQDCALDNLSRFQFYVVQWIEIENRAMLFLDRFDKHEDCFSINSPVDFKDKEKMEAFFTFLGAPRKQAELASGGRQNKNPTPTVVTDVHREEYAAVLGALPKQYLEIFHQAPYADFEWAQPLREGGC